MHCCLHFKKSEIRGLGLFIWNILFNKDHFSFTMINLMLMYIYNPFWKKCTLPLCAKGYDIKGQSETNRIHICVLYIRWLSEKFADKVIYGKFLLNLPLKFHYDIFPFVMFLIFLQHIIFVYISGDWSALWNSNLYYRTFTIKENCV